MADDQTVLDGRWWLMFTEDTFDPARTMWCDLSGGKVVDRHGNTGSYTLKDGVMRLSLPSYAANRMRFYASPLFRPEPTVMTPDTTGLWTMDVNGDLLVLDRVNGEPGGRELVDWEDGDFGVILKLAA